MSVNGLGQENASPGAFPAEVDAVVCGGGPGGSTFATLMARGGHRTVLFEREKSPRFHIGESLLPFALRLPSSVVLFALLAGGTLMGIPGALLALPVTAAVMMLIEELRVELPGEQEQPVDTELREADDRGEEGYERRTEGVGAKEAAAIAVEISADRRKDEAGVEG